MSNTCAPLQSGQDQTFSTDGPSGRSRRRVHSSACLLGRGQVEAAEGDSLSSTRQIQASPIKGQQQHLPIWRLQQTRALRPLAPKPTVLWGSARKS